MNPSKTSENRWQWAANSVFLLGLAAFAFGAGFTIAKRRQAAAVEEAQAVAEAARQLATDSTLDLLLQRRLDAQHIPPLQTDERGQVVP